MMRIPNEDQDAGLSQASALKMDVDSFVRWINSFESLSHDCTDMTELSSGIMLFEVLAEIDQKWFKLIKSADVGDNWVLKFNNLKKLYKLIERYFVDELGVDFKKIPPIDLNKIAKDSNVEETLKLCKLVLYIAVSCKENEYYVERILSLPEEIQRRLMFGIININKVTGYPDGSMPPNPAADQDASIPSDPFHGGALDALLQDNAELEAKHKELIKKDSELQRRFYHLETEIEDLKVRLRDMENAVAQASETGKTDFMMRSEIDHLKRKLQRSEDQRHVVEGLLQENDTMILELNDKVETLANEAIEVPRLQEKLRECDFALERLQKAENVIEKYKEKLNNCRGLQAQVKEFEERNRRLEEEMRQIKQELDQVQQFKSEIKTCKDTVSQLENESSENKRQLKKLEYENDQLQRKKITLVEDNSKDQEQIEMLQDTVHLGAGSKERTTTSDQYDDEMLHDDEDDTSGMDHEESVVQLKLTKRRLERQLKSLRERQSEGERDPLVLQPLLDDTNRLKERFEKEYLAASQERDILQSDLARIRDGIRDALLDKSEYTQADRIRIEEMQQQVKQLGETVKELRTREGAIKLDPRMDDISFDDQEWYDEWSQREDALNRQLQQQQDDIQRHQEERDMLENQCIEYNSSHFDKDPTKIEPPRREDEKAAWTEHDDLQQQSAELQQHLSETDMKLKRAKELIKKQDRMLKEIHLDGDAENHDEAMAMIKAEIKLRDDDNDKLKNKLHELRLQTRREQQLIISVWHEAARKTHRDLISSKLYSSPWYGEQQQRRRPDTQFIRLG